MAALISGHPVQKWIAIHLHPCNPALLPQITCSILFLGIFLSNLFVYLVEFGKIMWKLEIEISKISRDSVPLNCYFTQNKRLQCRESRYFLTDFSLTLTACFWFCCHVTISELKKSSWYLQGSFDCYSFRKSVTVPLSARVTQAHYLSICECRRVRFSEKKEKKNKNNNIWQYDCVRDRSSGLIISTI